MRIHAKNDRLMAAWYAQCASEGKLPPGFELSSNLDKVNNDKTTKGIENDPTDIDSPFNIEFTPEDKEKIVLDESVYENEIKIEDKKSFLETDIPKPKKKSFHRRRKEELKKRAFSKRIIITIVQEEKTEKKEKKKKKQNQIFNCFKFGSPDIIKILLGILLACSLIPLSAANPADPNGYRPSATKTDFRDVQHDPNC